MRYQQKRTSFFDMSSEHVSFGNMEIIVRYVELHDKSCVEFQHKHKDSFEIYYCLSGVQKLMVGEELHVLKPNSFCFLRPNVDHHTIYEPDIEKEYIVLLFDVPNLKSIVKTKRKLGKDEQFLKDALGVFEHTSCFQGSDSHGIGSVFDSLKNELIYHRPGRQFMIKVLYQQYLVAIMRYLINTPVATEPREDNEINLGISISRYMHENYNKHITTKEVAETFFISERHVNRVFQDMFGRSFKKALNIYRLNYAKNYLIDTDLSIEEISFLVGFSSPTRLNQLFREEDGISVSEYRKMHKKQAKPS